jgi:hypothetical protein
MLGVRRTGSYLEERHGVLHVDLVVQDLPELHIDRDLSLLPRFDPALPELAVQPEKHPDREDEDAEHDAHVEHGVVRRRGRHHDLDGLADLDAVEAETDGQRRLETFRYGHSVAVARSFEDVLVDRGRVDRIEALHLDDDAGSVEDLVAERVIDERLQ